MSPVGKVEMKIEPIENVRAILNQDKKEKNVVAKKRSGHFDESKKGK